MVYFRRIITEALRLLAVLYEFLIKRFFRFIGPQNVARRRSRKNVVNTFLSAIGAAACIAAIKRLSNLFIKK